MKGFHSIPTIPSIFGDNFNPELLRVACGKADSVIAPGPFTDLLIPQYELGQISKQTVTLLSTSRLV